MRKLFAISAGALILSVGLFMMPGGVSHGASPTLDQISAKLDEILANLNTQSARILSKLDEVLTKLSTQSAGILSKLDEVLTKLNTGGAEENHTLRWDKNLPSASRFTVLADFNNQAVLDKNTGLVWEQAPDVAIHTWINAAKHCVQKTVGGTVGWRLPSVVELRSVQDPSLSAPFVSASIFAGVQTKYYWSASSVLVFPDAAWAVPFSVTDVTDTWGKDAFPYAVWCVRGPMQESVY